MHRKWNIFEVDSLFNNKVLRGSVNRHLLDAKLFM